MSPYKELFSFSFDWKEAGLPLGCTRRRLSSFETKHVISSAAAEFDRQTLSSLLLTSPFDRSSSSTFLSEQRSLSLSLSHSRGRGKKRRKKESAVGRMLAILRLDSLTSPGFVRSTKGDVIERPAVRSRSPKRIRPVGRSGSSTDPSYGGRFPAAVTRSNVARGKRRRSENACRMKSQRQVSR